MPRFRDISIVILSTSLLTSKFGLGYRKTHRATCVLSSSQVSAPNGPGYDAALVSISVARGGKGAMPQRFIQNRVISCFERRFSKQNSAIRLKSCILSPQNFGAGYATARTPLS